MSSAEPVTARATSPAAVGGVRKAEVVINPLSGSVGADAEAQVARLLADVGVEARIAAPPPEELYGALRTAVDAAPDLLIVIAGDGTARAAASLCGAEGPLLAPLPGGTMNMLPHALYGRTDWKSALTRTLEEGVAVPVSGGEVDGRRFYVAAILGAPALWGEAREAVRHGQLGLAVRKAHNAWRRAFSRELKFVLDGGEPQKARALTLMCPLVSRAMPVDARALEADVLHLRGAREAFRLGFRALLSEFAGDWRADPAVDVARCRHGEAFASGQMPAILDGEPERLHKHVQIRFIPTAFRAFAPPPQPCEPAASVITDTLVEE